MFIIFRRFTIWLSSLFDLGNYVPNCENPRSNVRNAIHLSVSCHWLYPTPARTDLSSSAEPTKLYQKFKSKWETERTRTTTGWTVPSRNIMKQEAITQSVTREVLQPDGYYTNCVKIGCLFHIIEVDRLSGISPRTLHFLALYIWILFLLHFYNCGILNLITALELVRVGFFQRPHLF